MKHTKFLKIINTNFRFIDYLVTYCILREQFFELLANIYGFVVYRRTSFTILTHSNENGIANLYNLFRLKIEKIYTRTLYKYLCYNYLSMPDK